MNFESAPVEPKLMALFKFLAKVSRQPADIVREDFDRVREAGWNNEEITEGVLVASLYACANRFSAAIPFGRVVGMPFLLLGATLAVASLGWFKRRRWGWRLAVAIIATQVLGDLVNIYRGDFLRGGIGFLIAGALLFYLLQPQLRSAFARGESLHVG